MLPWFLRFMADVRAARTEEKVGHSGRDNSVRKPKSYSAASGNVYQYYFCELDRILVEGREGGICLNVRQLIAIHGESSAVRAVERSEWRNW